MGFWKPATVIEEPETKLYQWQIFRVAGNFGGVAETIHFMGYAQSEYAAYGGEGRVCSPVQEFDKETMRGRTSSGRIYELVGPPGLNSDALYVWNRWLQHAGNPVVTCITDEYYEKEKLDS